MGPDDKKLALLHYRTPRGNQQGVARYVSRHYLLNFPSLENQNSCTGACWIGVLKRTRTPAEEDQLGSQTGDSFDAW